MKVIILFTLISVVLISVYAEDEHEIKRGTFPFMAYIYYSDDTVVDVTGNRFLRGAVLISPDWLVTSAIQISSNDEEVRFPKKTLLARMGAMIIDPKFTINEDEDEQEREIIQIVRPSNHSATQWWQADITLMKTLLPFKISSVVAPALLLHPPYSTTTNSCSILVYAKRQGNTQENRILMQLPVELLSPSIETCGNHFYESTMTCASDREDKNAVYDPNFCQGNNGGPLVCDGKVLGLQTYIDNNCKPPHLYQLLAVWEKFLFCGTENKCGEEDCANRCVVTNKDAGTTTSQSWSTDWAEATTNKSTESILETLEYSPTLTIKTTEEIMTPKEEIFMAAKKVIITTEVEMNTTTYNTTTSHVTRTSEFTATSQSVPLTSEVAPTMPDETEKMSWPRKTIDDEEDVDRNTGVEAQREDESLYKKKQLTVVRSAAGRNTSMIQSICIACILGSLI